MLTKLINSKVTAFILGAWVAYCTGLGDYDGAVFLIFVYIVLNFFNKKVPVLEPLTRKVKLFD